MTLYEIKTEITDKLNEIDQALNPAEGEPDYVVVGKLHSQLDSLFINKEQKILTYGIVIKSQDVEIAARKVEIDKQKTKIKQLESTQARLEGEIDTYLITNSLDKVSDNRISITRQRASSPAVIIELGTVIDKRFERVKTVIDTDKTAIKEAILAGETFEGMELKYSYFLKIK